MIFVREASAAVVLVTLTLSLQCAGMASLTSLPSRIADSLAEWMRQQPKLCQIPVIAVTAHALACRAAAFLAGRLQRLRFQTCEFQATWWTAGTLAGPAVEVASVI